MELGDRPGPPLPIEQEIRTAYETDAPGMLRYAFGIAGSLEAAQDAVQEVFLRFFVARSAGQEIRRPKAWMFRVLRNHILDQKKSGAHQEIGLDSLKNEPGRGPDPESDYSRFEVLRRTVLTSLSPREVECVQLRAEGLCYEEIAGALNLRSGTVGALLTRAHKKIRLATAATAGKSGEMALQLAGGKRYAS